MLRKKHSTLISGDISEAMVAAAFVCKKVPVSVPFESSCCYDLVIERKSGFKKIQVKTGKLSDWDKNVIHFSVSRVKATTKVRTSYTNAEVDFFAVYVHSLRKVYLIPFKDLKSKTIGSLRLKPSLSGQKKGIMLAKDYEYYNFNID